jgi:predicted membrane protein
MSESGSGGSSVPVATKPFSDIQSIVGFLLGLFATAFSFLGISTGEVTSILRNAPDDAPLVALPLVLGVLAAVLTVVASDKADVASSLDLATLVVVLIGVATLVIRAIPIPDSKGLNGLWLVPIYAATAFGILGHFLLDKDDLLLKRVVSLRSCSS